MGLSRLGQRVQIGCLVGAVAVSGLIAAAPANAAPNGPTARYVDTMTVPDNFVPTPFRFGGLSGIDNIGGGNYVAVSDDKGEYGPARYFQFRLPITGNGQFATRTPVLTNAGTILGPGNIPLLPGQMDLEGIRKLGGNFVVSSEGARPFVRVVSPPGLYVRDIPIPAAYRPGPGRGLKTNDGFEGLTVTRSGQVALMTESALVQDGGDPTKAAGTRSRLLITGARGNSEYVYRTDPLARNASSRATNGVSEILSISSTDYLVLERGFDPAANRNTIKVYVATTRGATSVTGVNKLSGREVPMSKRLVFDFAKLPMLRPDNVEGMAWGPTISGGRRTLILISDDNFNNPAQHTKLHTLALTF
ncbi:esterase-like activity of phytase family protein [Williamsia sp.]|uniref:esterase-like activity of phytase family protein n=1 Tax=Williamsia sp. TaxID=1872085 RepID=UPI001A1B3ECD|nr:esterase-like activity of phytase family protein [Williamsia sp.]MBJ7291098.1 esterase-like activity of phytase family protein [Williamsia sp.]